MKRLEDRFWEKVLVGDDCWGWIASKNSNGYGKILVRLELKWHSLIASRVSWFLSTGEWPSKFILHKCDNPACIRFSHLFQGTQNDNVKDAWGKRKNGCVEF
jgi:hypothetical protein